MMDFYKPLRKHAHTRKMISDNLLPHSMTGEWKGLRFIISEDRDGQVEASLSRSDLTRVRPRQERAFFKMWGIDVPQHRVEMPVSTHFIVRGPQ